MPKDILPPGSAFRNRFAAAALALLTGVVGGHRFYLRGMRDTWAWLHPAAFALGLLGVWRFVVQQRTDMATWVLLAAFIAVVLAALIQALVIGLTADDRWDARWNAGTGRRSANGWGPVMVAMITLFGGFAALAGGLAYVLQRLFGGLG